MKADIVKRLRDWAATICTVHGKETPGSKAKMARDAADEIEQLRAAHAEMQRMVCRALYTDELMQRNHAKVCGWLCFEEKP